MKVLVTGAAGFIGSHVSQQLLDKGMQVVGLDNLNDYYSVQLKKDRLVNLLEHAAFEFVKIDVEDTSELSQLFEKHRFDKVIHLAAQAGVRYSLDNPMAYINANVVGFTNILESCRHNKINVILIC